MRAIVTTKSGNVYVEDCETPMSVKEVLDTFNTAITNDNWVKVDNALVNTKFIESIEVKV